jgi:hypothetical protein
MCEITEKLNTFSEQFIGYKMVVRFNNKLYSPYTGIQYKVGPVPVLTTKPKKYKVYFSSINFNDIHAEKRLTAVFINKEDALESLERNRSFMDKNDKLELIKMTIGGNLYTGYFGSDEVILGDRILKIEKI